MKGNRGYFVGVAIYSVVVILLDLINFRSDFNIVRELFYLAIQFWIFYSFLQVLILASTTKLYFFLVLLFSMGITIMLNYVRGIIGEYYGFETFNNNRDFVISSITIYIRFSLYAVGYFFFKQLLEKQQQMALAKQKVVETEKNKLEADNRVLQLQEEQATLQAQLLEAEINFLKAQINPHFLFNCLNFFYSEALTVQPKLAEGIIALSQVMRYSMQDFSRMGNIASLEEELNHIQNVIHIHQMRYMETLKITLQVEGNPAGITVIPMVLITLVENVFKHGDLGNAGFPAQISCKIDEQQKSVSFSTVNLKKTKNLNHGIETKVGIQNIKQRLKQLYREDCELSITDEANYFKVVLIFFYQNKTRANNLASLAMDQKIVYD